MSQIEFDIINGMDWPCYHLFWRKLRPWFTERGYLIHNPLTSRSGSSYSPTSPRYTPAVPYSYYDNIESDARHPPRSVEISVRNFSYEALAIVNSLVAVRQAGLCSRFANARSFHQTCTQILGRVPNIRAIKKCSDCI